MSAMRKSMLEQKIHNEANFIVAGVKQFNILDDAFSLEYIMIGTNISFSIKKNGVTYSQCDAVYTQNLFTGVVSGAILYVSSIIGNKSGTFLFLLQMLLAMKINATELTLDNVTNQPERAASQKGIYGLFQVDQRGFDRGDFVGKTLGEQLIESTGQMRWGNTSDAAQFWILHIQHFAATVNDNLEPWGGNIVNKINYFIAYLKSTHQPGVSLGGKRNKKKRKTRKQKPNPKSIYKKKRMGKAKKTLKKAPKKSLKNISKISQKMY
jgi:hypothetical protein